MEDGVEMTSTAIEFNEVAFEYEETKVFENISFKVNKGEWLAVAGHNGSGKSTLAKLVIGLFQPSKGEIRVNGIKLSEDTIWEIRRDIGLVFQNPDNQFVGTTVQDDVAFGLENAGIKREEMVVSVQNALNSVKMSQFSDREPHLLSGGQKQRVAIAGVIALEPSIIILDESTAMLDPKGCREVLEVINKLRFEKNITIISITHNLEEVVKADRVLVLNEGEVYAQGTPEEIFARGEALTEIGLALPFGIQVADELRKNGLDIESKLLISELVEQLCK